MNAEMDMCMQVCGECALGCDRCGAHCLDMGGAHAAREHQVIMRDCADVCGLAAAMMARGSKHASHVCAECAEICMACAASCERLSNNDRMMDSCAQLCRRCARECQKMSGAAV